MVRHDGKVYRRYGEPPDVPSPHIEASRRTLTALQTLRWRHGPQVIVLGSARACVGVARVRSAAGFVARSDLVRISTLADSPVYANERAAAACPHTVLILDVHFSANDRPVFVTGCVPGAV